MRARPAQVAEQLGIVTAGLFEGVGQDREAGESALLINRPGESRDRCFVPRHPPGQGEPGFERVADDVKQQPTLGQLLRPMPDLLARASLARDPPPTFAYPAGGLPRIRPSDGAGEEDG